MGAIAGCLGAAADPAQLQKMLDSMKYRCHRRCEALPVREGVLMCPAGDAVESREGQMQIVFSGRIDNREKLRRELMYPEGAPEAVDDGALVLCAYRKWGRDCMNRLKGPFAFAVWEDRRRRLFLARDQMGMEPLFYRISGNRFLFASEIKTILAAPGIRAQLDAEGAAQLILLGPGRKPGSGVFRDIQALEPGCWGIYEQGRLTVSRYWKLRDREHSEGLEETAERIRNMVSAAISGQMEAAAGTFLSGGLDSSIISALCAEKARAEGRTLHTFSVDYQDNERYFVPGEFQPGTDNQYIAEMAETIESCHHTTVLTPADLTQQLEEATVARDLPGMGDVDFSLMAFCKEIKKSVPVALSGECADELFGGYPWFQNPETDSADCFPWARNTGIRSRLLAHSCPEHIQYVAELYRDTCRQTDVLPGTDHRERRVKEMVNLNLSWFMQTLLERNDRMCCGLEIRVPFCDYELAQYLYAIPWEMKNYQGREKGLLRYAVRGMLPETVRMRKKAPYPKTFDPQYESLIMARMHRVFSENSPLWYLLDQAETKKLLGAESMDPWYGQLMRRPQFMAWLLQIDFWLRHYDVEMCF